MVRHFLFIYTLLFVYVTQAQSDSIFRYQSMLKGTATICPGFLLSNGQTDIYLNGDLEYFADEKISIRGDGFWMVGAQQKDALLKNNSAVFFGALYHFHKNRFDYFIGIQSGLSITKPNNQPNGAYQLQPAVPIREYDYKLLPNFSPITGITFYVSDYFNFFLNVRYVYARYYGYESSSVKLDEIRISAGLGFQIHTKRKKK